MRNYPSTTIAFSIFALLSIQAFSQKITISGYIRDADTKEALISATIYETKLQRGTTTNEYGFYSLTLPARDTLDVMISYTGYKFVARKISSKQNIRLDILLASSNLLSEVEIIATRNDDNVNRPEMGVIDVSMKDIKNLPVLMGERDILKIIQFLPGVQAGQEGTTGFFVRGEIGRAHV